MQFIDQLSFLIIEKKLNKLYSRKFKKFGAHPKSVFWKNKFTQDYRLQLIINLLIKLDNLKNTKISDIGCGYGRLLQKMIENNLLETSIYYGVDINEDFISFCKSKYNYKNVNFQKNTISPCDVDFTVMSGTYNLCTLDNLVVWEKYIYKCLSENWKKTKNSMIFNLLEKKDRVIDGGLYYSNINWIKKLCEENFGTTCISKSNLLPHDILVVVKR